MGLAAERRNNSICATPRAKCILIRPQDQPTLDRQNSQFLGITTWALHNAMVLQEKFTFPQNRPPELAFSVSSGPAVLCSSCPPVPVVLCFRSLCLLWTNAAKQRPEWNETFLQLLCPILFTLRGRSIFLRGRFSFARTCILL